MTFSALDSVGHLSLMKTFPQDTGFSFQRITEHDLIGETCFPTVLWFYMPRSSLPQ